MAFDGRNGRRSLGDTAARSRRRERRARAWRGEVGQARGRADRDQHREGNGVRRDGRRAAPARGVVAARPASCC